MTIFWFPNYGNYNSNVCVIDDKLHSLMYCCLRIDCFSKYDKKNLKNFIHATNWSFNGEKEEKQKTITLKSLFTLCSWLIPHRWPGVKLFQRLATIAKLVLVLPHSNADAERVFSLVGLNKTKTRNSLALDRTVSSIMTIKMAGLEPCFKWEPGWSACYDHQAIIKASKKATS